MGTSVKSIAGESDITPKNGHMRVQDVRTCEEMRCGMVTDDRTNEYSYGDIVYFPKDKGLLTRINGSEATFVKKSDVIFKVGA